MGVGELVHGGRVGRAMTYHTRSLPCRPHQLSLQPIAIGPFSRVHFTITRITAYKEDKEVVRPALIRADNLDLDTLMALAERKAVSEADGHLTIFRFTTGWKCILKTPDLDSGAGRNEILNLQTYPNLN